MHYCPCLFKPQGFLHHKLTNESLFCKREPGQIAVQFTKDYILQDWDENLISNNQVSVHFQLSLPRTYRHTVAFKSITTIPGIFFSFPIAPCIAAVDLNKSSYQGEWHTKHGPNLHFLIMWIIGREWIKSVLASRQVFIFSLSHHSSFNMAPKASMHRVLCGNHMSCFSEQGM